MLWLRSRERGEVIRCKNATCERCHKKRSTAKGKEVKIEVHHKEGILNWDEIIDSIRTNLLCDPDYLEVLCVDCHKDETYGT